MPVRTMKNRLLVVDFFLCDADLLRSKGRIRSCLLAAAKAGRAHVLKSVFHEFREGGKGVTGVLLLAESHISIHTWPEHQTASIDVFGCGRIDMGRILEALKAGFGPEKCRVKTVLR